MTNGTQITYETFWATCAGLSVTMLLGWTLITVMLATASIRFGKKELLGVASPSRTLFALLVVMAFLSVGVLFVSLFELGGFVSVTSRRYVAGILVAQGTFYAVLLIVNGIQVVKGNKSGK